MRAAVAVTFAALSLALAGAARAEIVFFDNFDTYDDGAAHGQSALNFNGFSGLTVDGAVDIVANGDFAITCSGKCVDLDGTPGAGALVSGLYTFSAGDLVNLTFDLAGSQRNAGVNDFFAQLLDPGGAVLTSIGGNVGEADPFSLRSLSFVAPMAGSARFRIGTQSADFMGPLLDNVRLEVGPAVPEPSTWAMMLIGFAAVGLTMRRGRDRQALRQLA